MFVSGFAAQIKDEHNVQIKDAMLQYFSELFEDANDFSWMGAKNCHAAVCCRMEEDKLDWLNTFGLDRCRNAYSQRPEPPKSRENFSNNENFEPKRIVACSFYNNSRCNKPRDHENANTAYKHI